MTWACVLVEYLYNYTWMLVLAKVQAEHGFIQDFLKGGNHLTPPGNSAITNVLIAIGYTFGKILGVF